MSGVDELPPSSTGFDLMSIDGPNENPLDELSQMNIDSDKGEFPPGVQGKLVYLHGNELIAHTNRIYDVSGQLYEPGLQPPSKTSTTRHSRHTNARQPTDGFTG